MKERKRKRSEHTHPAARFAAILQNHYRLRPPALPIPQISPPSPPPNASLPYTHFPKSEHMMKKLKNICIFYVRVV